MRILKYSLLAFLGIGCGPTQSQNIEIITSLPKKIKESSAAEVVKNSSLVWTIEDQKNQSVLFGISMDGNLVQEISILNVENNDWEDLTSDDEGNIYIGDFGNNDNDRQNLAIYKVKASDLNKNQAEASEIIQFYYPEQKDFPPKKKEFFYDVEAFFYKDGNFYLFTKNRSSNFDGITTLYKVPNNPNERLAAQKISTFTTCDTFNKCAITSAAISPNGKKVALLTSDKVYLFTDFKGDDYFSGKSKIINLGHSSQKEGLDFEDNNTVLITDEASKKEGSNLYRLRL